MLTNCLKYFWRIFQRILKRFHLFYKSSQSKIDKSQNDVTLIFVQEIQIFHGRYF
jgi:hypothetical protein